MAPLISTTKASLPLWKALLLPSLLSLSLLMGCPSALTNIALDPDMASSPNEVIAATLGSGDSIFVRVFGEADLTGEYQVMTDGTIDFPLIGKVQASGKFTTEVVADITEKLKGRYLLNPQVSILVKSYQSKKVYVFGQVKQPGTFAFVTNMNIIQAITMAGGFGPSARRNSVSVTRYIDDRKKQFIVPVEKIGEGAENNFLLMPGDLIFIPESIF